MSTTEHDHAPWNWTGDRFATHYGHPVSGGAPEEMEHDAARDWAENGNPQNGDRWGEFYVKDSQLWNDGKYCAADGSAEPYKVMELERITAETDAAWAQHEAQPVEQDGRAR